MKARVKATGEIVSVKAKTYIANGRWDVGIRYEDIDRNIYYKEHLDFENLTEVLTDVKEKSFPKDEPDYWEKLYHQAAIAAMQGLLSNSKYNTNTDFSTTLKGVCNIATALIEKLKNEK